MLKNDFTPKSLDTLNKDKSKTLELVTTPEYSVNIKFKDTNKCGDIFWIYENIGKKKEYTYVVVLNEMQIYPITACSVSEDKTRYECFSKNICRDGKISAVKNSKIRNQAQKMFEDLDKRMSKFK